MQGRPCGTLRTALQLTPASQIFADGWKGMTVSVFETLSHHKIGQSQPICPTFLDLHYLIALFLEERTGRQAHLGGNFRDSVFPGLLFHSRNRLPTPTR